MKKQILATLLLAVASAPAFAQQPAYCTDFPAEACTRMKTVIESKARPTYCKPGPAQTSRGSPLSTEQLRICYTMQDPAVPIPSLTASSANEKKLAEDTRAMVRQTWATYGQSIKNTEIARRCNLVDQSTAILAVHNTQLTMHDLLIRAGLFGETELNIDKETELYVQAGQQAVLQGACTAMTPLTRDQLRQSTLILTRR